MNATGPIFIVGMNGSGTTMLADSLAHHPQLYVLPHESKVLPYFLQRQSEFGDLGQLDARRRLAAEIGRSKAYWQSNGKQDLVLSDSALSEPGFAAVVSAIYLHFAERQGKRRWGDKSPINTQHIAALAQAFTDARFVHIVRDGRDAAQSFHRRWGFHPVHTILRWKRIVGMGIRQGGQIGAHRYLQVTYESLTRQPAEEMKRICDFLDLEFDEAILKSSMPYLDPGAAQRGAGTMVQNSNKWQRYFNSDQVAALEKIAGRMLVSLGYSASSAGDFEPPKWRVRLWSLRDRMVFTRWFFRTYGWRALPMYLRQAKSAARQRLTANG